MATSRQKILNYIIEQQSTTVEELSKAFHVTPANIRHHLSILAEQGSITVIGVKENVSKGRPSQIYTSKYLIEQNNLNMLSTALLHTIFHPDTNDNTRKIEDIAKHIAEKFTNNDINPTRRLYSTIYALNQMNYQAHWEAHVLTPRIMLGHCPYQAILDDHPEICRIDAALLEELLKSPVRQIEKQTINLKGFSHCVFLVNRVL
jgi:predicted ArsR family transcriptional regulator